MQQQSTRFFKLSTLSLAMALTACGGGGGDSSTSAPVTAATRTVAGTAAKGILKGARVQAFSLDANGVKNATAVATGTTAADGSYSIKVPADILTFVIEVDGGAGGTMLDEATGLELAIPATLKLRDVVKLASSAESTIEGSVSPLTEMIVQSAEKATGGLSAANIADAKSGFAKVFGFDPEQVRPINPRSDTASGASETQKVQALLLAGISKMAKDGKLGCDGSDGERIVCITGKVGKLATMADGVLTLDDGVRTEIRAAFTAVTNDHDINKTGKSSTDGNPAFAETESKTPATPSTPTESKIPVAPSAPTAVAAAKLLLASLRTNMAVLTNTGNTSALDMRADAMRADFDKAIAPLDPDLGKWIQLTTRGIDYLRAYQANGGPNTMSMHADGAHIGGCGIYSDANGNTPATSKADAVSVGCSIVRKNVPQSFPNQGQQVVTKQVTAAFTILPVSDTSYTYVSRARLETLLDNVRSTPLDVTLGTYNTTPNRANGTIEYVKSGNTVTNLTVAGVMPARTDAYGNTITDRETWDLSAVRTDEGSNQFKYAFSGAITSIKADVPVGKVSINPGSFVRTQEVTQNASVSTKVKEFSLSLGAESGGSKLTGTLNMSNAMLDLSGQEYQPTAASFVGSLSTNSAEFFVGTLTFAQPNFAGFNATLPETANNFDKKTASLVGTLTIPNRPALKASVSVSNDAFNSSSLSAQYDDGSIVINVSSTDANHGVTPKVTTISSTAGVSITQNGTTEVLDVLKDNAKVGLINVKTGRIDYVDGSFESLK